MHTFPSQIYEVINVCYCYSLNFIDLTRRLGGELFCLLTVSLILPCYAWLVDHALASLFKCEYVCRVKCEQFG